MGPIFGAMALAARVWAGGPCDCSPERTHKLQETDGVYRGNWLYSVTNRGFPEIGVPPNHPILDGIFHSKFIHCGVPPSMETHKWPKWVE